MLNNGSVKGIVSVCLSCGLLYLGPDELNLNCVGVNVSEKIKQQNYTLTEKCPGGIFGQLNNMIINNYDKWDSEGNELK